MNFIYRLNESFTESEAGAKALSLSFMLRAGLPVPGGFVINNKAFEKFRDIEFDSMLLEELQTAVSQIGAKAYMVRSSALGEDSAESSFAGQLDSFICSSEISDLIEHIKLCWSSRFKENVRTYEKSTGIRLKGMGVVVQELIEPDLAGVLFTRHPYDEKKILIEFVKGHGEKLVSGEVTPDSMIVEHSKSDKNEEFKSLIKDALRLEKKYGFPLDIEWVIKDGKHLFVQARPITSASASIRQYWSNTNVNENYPEPISPLLYSIARDAYSNYFKNLSRLFMVPEEKIGKLESSYANVIGIFGARMYYNMSSIHKIISASPFSEMLSKSFNHFVGYADESETDIHQEKGNKLKFVRELFRFNLSLGKSVKTFENNADSYSKNVESAIAFHELRECFHGFIEIRMHSWYKASLADFFAMLYHGLLGKFCRRFYGESSEGIHNKLIQAIPGLISSQPILSLYHIKCKIRENAALYEKFRNSTSEVFLNVIQTEAEYGDLKREIESHIQNWGFRCSGELMLSHSTYIEEPHKFIELLQQYDRLPDSDPSALMSAKFEERLSAISAFKKTIFNKRGLNFPLAIIETFVLNLLIRMASKGIASRERVRLKQALLYFRFKQVLQKSGREFVKRKLIENSEDILFLRYQEIAENFSSSDMLPGDLKQRIQNRKSEFSEMSKLTYPDDFFSVIGQYPSPDKVQSSRMQTNGQNGGLNGMPVCGGIVKARARVLNSVMEAHRLEKGDILVTRQTDPGWVLVFPLISGLIVERGGMLSHGAIVSREFGIPAIVGVDNAVNLIKDGDMILMNADTGNISICNE